MVVTRQIVVFCPVRIKSFGRRHNHWKHCSGWHVISIMNNVDTTIASTKIGSHIERHEGT